jgi:hypothetical protein
VLKTCDNWFVGRHIQQNHLACLFGLLYNGDFTPQVRVRGGFQFPFLEDASVVEVSRFTRKYDIGQIDGCVVPSIFLGETCW